ncbi:MAG: hypothetical protein WKG07_34905 [Hymenobacter sp.]
MLAVYTVTTGFVLNVVVLTQQTDLLHPTQAYYSTSELRALALASRGMHPAILCT